MIHGIRQCPECGCYMTVHVNSGGVYWTCPCCCHDTRNYTIQYSTHIEEIPEQQYQSYRGERIMMQGIRQCPKCGCYMTFHVNTGGVYWTCPYCWHDTRDYTIQYSTHTEEIPEQHYQCYDKTIVTHTDTTMHKR